MAASERGRGRPRALDHCDDIAPRLVEGYSFPSIADALGISLQKVKKRVNTMREELAVETGDGAWIDKSATTNVQVGRAWCERRGLAGVTSSPR